MSQAFADHSPVTRIYLRAHAEHALLPAADQRALLRRYQKQGDLDARSRLVEANQRLVISIAAYYWANTPNRSSLTFMDLIQEGNLGMLRAIEQFDLRKPWAFTTYAVWWIRQAIGRSLHDRGRVIRVPAGVQITATKALKIAEEHLARTGAEATIAEIADRMNLSKKSVEVALSLPRVQSLDRSAYLDDSDDGDTLADTLSGGEDRDTMLTGLFDKIQRTVLLDLLDRHLTPRHVRAVKLRFGLDPICAGEPMALDDIGRRMGVTRERVRQMVVEAILALRRPEVRGEIRRHLERAPRQRPPEKPKVGRYTMGGMDGIIRARRSARG